jgi:hypothetical protein
MGHFSMEIGAPTGSNLSGNQHYRIMADCAAKNKVIYDEWLIRDQGALVRQMGWDSKTYAADLITREGGPEHCVKPLTPATDRKGDYNGKGNKNDTGQRYADVITRIMNADMSVITRVNDRACHLELPGDITGHGWTDADQFWMGLRAACTNAKFQIDHMIGRDDTAMAPRAALRWSLTGKHEGWGAFGKPSGAEVYVLGISHADFGPWGLRREYVLYDETAIWKQILLKAG